MKIPIPTIAFALGIFAMAGFSCKKKQATLPPVITGDITKITGTHATAFLTVVDEGNTIHCGVCWSTNANPTIDVDHTDEGSGRNEVTTDINGLTPKTTYHVRAYITNDENVTEYGDDKIFTTTGYTIGDPYEGGTIFYILAPGDAGYNPGILHGLIATSWSVFSEKDWKSGLGSNTGAIDTAIGTGKVNTNKIVSNQGNDNYAAKACYDLILYGYSDWFLPSKKELEKLYLSRDEVGIKDGNVYWSSSEYDAGSAYTISMSTGKTGLGGKSFDLHFRPVREF